MTLRSTPMVCGHLFYWTDYAPDDAVYCFRCAKIRSVIIPPVNVTRSGGGSHLPKNQRMDCIAFTKQLHANGVSVKEITKLMPFTIGTIERWISE